MKWWFKLQCCGSCVFANRSSASRLPELLAKQFGDRVRNFIIGRAAFGMKSGTSIFSLSNSWSGWIRGFLFWLLVLLFGGTLYFLISSVAASTSSPRISLKLFLRIPIASLIEIPFNHWQEQLSRLASVLGSLMG